MMRMLDERSMLTRGADALGWLAYADLCEERGQMATAALWRDRAAVLEALEGLGRGDWICYRGETVEVWLSTGGAVTFRACPATWQVITLRPNGVYGFRAFLMRKALRRARPEYLRDRAILLVAAASGGALAYVEADDGEVIDLATI